MLLTVLPLAPSWIMSVISSTSTMVFGLICSLLLVSIQCISSTLDFNSSELVAVNYLRSYEEAPGRLRLEDGYGSGQWIQTSAPSAYWVEIASDSTGRYLAAVVDIGGGIYVNSNYGSGSWTQTSAPNTVWGGIDSDSTGMYLAAVAYDVGIYTSKFYSCDISYGRYFIILSYLWS